MSNLLVRFLLAILLIPLAGLLYVVVYFVLSDTHSDQRSMVTSGLGVWAFVAIYWIALWHGAIRWNRRRVIAIVVVAILASILSGLVAVTINSRSRYYSSPFGYFVGSVMAPLLWLVGAVLVWRERSDERFERLSAAGQKTVVCPACGYNLTGLREVRCPECGMQMTIDQLLAAQPGQSTAELSDS